jgi:hypothetical protein
MTVGLLLSALSIEISSTLPLGEPVGNGIPLMEFPTQPGALFCRLHRCAAAACRCFRLMAMLLTLLMVPALTVQGHLQRLLMLYEVRASHHVAAN